MKTAGSRTKASLRICLINPPVLIPKNYGGVDLFQPLGLAYIAAILKENHYPVSIIDAAAEGWENIKTFDKERDYNGLDYDQIGRMVKKKAFNIVGITITFTVQKDSALKLAEEIKKIDKDIVVIVGGPHVTVQPEACVSDPNIDFAVVGEGEETIVELVKAIKNKAKATDLKKILGIAYKDKDSVVVTPPRPYISNLDKLPFPARELLPMEIYFKAAKKKRANRDLDKPWATVITSRGCPFNCVFCSLSRLMGRRWRARSPENVIEEIKILIDKYGVKQIDFEDDNISCDKRRMERICDLIIENKLKIEWFTPNGIRADTLDEPLLKKMKASGCRELWFAPESGSQRVVNEVIEKRIDLKIVEKMVLACKKVGISSNCFFVIGLPGETKKEIKQTISFAQKLGRLGADNCLFSIATPLYGTRLYEIVVKKGYLKNSDELLRYDSPVIETPEFSIEELVELRNRALAENRSLYVRNSINKFFYYLKNNPVLALEHLHNMFKIATLFINRNYNVVLKKLLRSNAKTA